MNRLRPAEPALATAHEHLAIALALVGDYDHLDPRLTPAQLGALTLRVQLIVTVAAPIADALATLIKRGIHASQEAGSDVRPLVTELVSAETARNCFIGAHDKLRRTHDELAGARQQLCLAGSQVLHPTAARLRDQEDYS